ncbi:FtsK/SpoIIIE domain-containing protein [Herpetosiphon llansteffanensis]|uniref:FtsK/SpoIIIE domain-containing protein n=1 Tax=Herpetosiphon llansteffanensis TaxID=2094568 RepID=UPI000D7BD347|nr:FtsK/SpoIIIE domain-containing protein [Herpetosiphon llansteffanensis]
MSNIEALQQEIRDLEAQINLVTGQANQLILHGRTHVKQISPFFETQLNEQQQKAQTQIQTFDPVHAADWTLAQWQQWNAQTANPYSILRYGRLIENKLNQQFSIPALLPFIGNNSSIIVQTSGEQAYEQGKQLLQSLLIRTALMVPHQASYSLLDPAGNGQAYPMRRQLPNVTPNSDDVARDVDQVINEIRRKIETYLDAEVRSFEQIPHEIRINEHYHFVFAANFPNKYDRRAIEKLQSAAITGPQAGCYVFIHHNQDYELPRDLSMDGFSNAFWIDLTQKHLDLHSTPYIIQHDAAPSAEVQKFVFERLANTKPSDSIITWQDVAGIPEQQWWTGDSSQLIEVPIGKRGGSEALKIWFGEDAEGRPCAHGILGAMTGSGKSSLYHSLILGLAVRYSPAELRFYLIDGKYGVEFQPYRQLPHAEVVSLHTSAELSRSVLAELLAEMERRNAIFTRRGVTGISSYRRQGQPDGSMPRILLIVDEYQQLFENDRDGNASRMLNQLSAQGRNTGIHMLLASQRYGAAGMLNQTAIFGNIHLRMAMQMAEPDIRALTEFGSRGKGLILATCNRPGKLVINDRAGDENANFAGKTAFITPEYRDQLIQQLIAKAQPIPPADLPQRIVFNGNSQPNVLDNPVIRALTQRKNWPAPSEIDQLAKRSQAQGGWEVADWHAVERPFVAWIGQEFNVRGQANLILRRRDAEHGVIVGNNHAARYGMMLGIITSFALQSNPQALRFIIIDRSISGSDWSSALEHLSENLLRPAGYTVGFNRKEAAIEGMFDFLITILQQRKTLAEDELAQAQSIVVVMSEIDRIEQLRRINDGYGFVDSPLGVKFHQLYSDGSRYGIHLILSANSMRSFSAIIDEKRGLPYFNHRIALQMSEEESFALVRNRKAAMLQVDGPYPVSALYTNIENDQQKRIKPYSLQPDAEQPNRLIDEIQLIGQSLSDRS